MNDDTSHYGSAGWAVLAIGILAIVHAMVVQTVGVGEGFLKPIDGMVIGTLLLIVGTLMVRHGGGEIEGNVE